MAFCAASNYSNRTNLSNSGGTGSRPTSGVPSPAREADPVDVLALHTALDDLAALDPRQAEIVEMRFFAGLTVEEIAEVMEISTATVKREWATAKLWLRREMQGL